MCECLEYKDGDMYLCPVDVDIYKEMQAKLDEQAKEIKRLAAALMASKAMIERAEMHPDACCDRCSEGLAERDKLRRQVEAADRLITVVADHARDGANLEPGCSICKRALIAYEASKP